MTRALVIYCHPSPESFTAAVRDVVLAELATQGARVTLIDLYATEFDPVLSPEDFAAYGTPPPPVAPVADHVAALKAADTLIFVYPTWWYSHPARLKGWFDRVLLPEIAFEMPSHAGGDIRPGLTHVTRLGVFTTCGASRWLTFLIGAPGRRVLTRGVRLLCNRRTRIAFAAHYAMDSSTPESRARHLRRVQRRMRQLLR
ncbi:MAG: NAD(P)H-dependent oxidoreductase [Rhodobacteraceae bacterium]|nr:NAD(P)H-dependent oxidoreductase [Paracoccaceae bacterium]